MVVPILQDFTIKGVHREYPGIFQSEPSPEAWETEVPSGIQGLGS